MSRLPSPNSLENCDAERTKRNTKLALRENGEASNAAAGTGNHLAANHLAEVIIRGGRGTRVWDVSGNEYIDFLLGSDRC